MLLFVKSQYCSLSITFLSTGIGTNSETFHTEEDKCTFMEETEIGTASQGK